jgi:hypothetical protein
MTSISSLRKVGQQSAYQVLSAMDQKSMLPIFMRDCVDNVRRVAITKAWNPTAGEELFRTEWVTAFVWGWGVNLANKAWDKAFKLTGLKHSSHLGWEDLKSLFGNINPKGFASRSLQFHTSPQAQFLHSLTPEALASLAPSPEVAQQVSPLLNDLKTGNMLPHLKHYGAKVAFTMMAPSLFIGVGMPFLNHYYTEEKRKKILATTTTSPNALSKAHTPITGSGKGLGTSAKNTFPETSVIFSPEINSPFAKQPLEYSQAPTPTASAKIPVVQGSDASTQSHPQASTKVNLVVSPLPKTGLPSSSINEPQTLKTEPATRFGSAAPLQSALSFAFTERGQTLIGVDAPISLGRVFTSRDPSEAAIWGLREGLFLVMQFFGADLIQNKLTEFLSKRQAPYTAQRFETLHTLKQALAQHETHGVADTQWQQRLTQGWDTLADSLKATPNKAAWHPEEELALVKDIYHYFSPQNRMARMQKPNALFDMAAHLGHIPVYKASPEKLFPPHQLEYVRSKASQYIGGDLKQVALTHRPLVDLTHVAGAKLDQKIATDSILELAKLLQETSQKALPLIKQELNSSYKYKAVALAAGNISSYLVLAELMPRAQQWLSYLIRGDKSAPGIPTELQTHHKPGAVSSQTQAAPVS